MNDAPAPVATGGGSPTATAEHDGKGALLLYRGAAGAFAVQVGGAGLGLAVHVVIARLLGAAGYGTYTLALTWVSVLSVLALLGQGIGVVRFVPTYVHGEAWSQLRGLRRGASAVVLAASGAVSLLGGCLVYLLRSRLGEGLEITMLAGFVLLPVLTQLQLSGALHRGLKRAASSSAFNSLVRPTLLLALVLGYSFGLHARLTAPLAMGATCLAALGALVASERFLNRAWPPEARRASPRYETRSWLTVGGQLFFLAVIGIVLNRVDVLVLGGMTGAADVGPYYAAVQIGAISAYGLNAVNTILAPLIAERYAAGDRDALAKLVHRAAWLTFSVTGLVCLVAAGLGRWILGLFGPGFEVAYIPLLIILGGQCVNAASGPVGFLMTMTRFERQAPAIFGGGAVVNVLLSVLLIPQLGILGAATATATATVVWNVAALVFVRRNLDVNPTIVPFLVR